MSTFLENQNWRYATKKFDSTKKISNEDLNYFKRSYSFEFFFLWITTL